MADSNVAAASAGLQELTPYQRDVMFLMEQGFIANEREIQNEIYMERKGRSPKYDGQVTGFGTDEPARFHIDDIDEIIRIDKMKTDGAEDVNRYYDHFESLAEYRCRNEFLKQIIDGFDEFTDIIYPEGTVNKDEYKDTLVDTQKQYNEWVNDYKGQLVKLLGGK
jgi:hypothetical protein